MSRSIPENLRLFVGKRANNCCEYCQIPQVSRFIRFHIEHIVGIKHGGKTIEFNLALACPTCNYFKGSDVATFLSGGQWVRFFNPRMDNWAEHFEVFEGKIYSKTSIGEATTRIFQFNTPDRIIYRKEVLELLG